MTTLSLFPLMAGTASRSRVVATGHEGGVFSRGWSKRRDHWRLRIGRQTVALAVPSGLHWKVLGFVDGQTVLCRIFDDEATAMEAAEGWAKDASSHSSRRPLQ